MSDNRPGFCHLCEINVIHTKGLCVECLLKEQERIKKLSQNK